MADSQTLRQWLILRMIAAEESVTIRRLIERSGVSDKTIRRDSTALRSRLTIIKISSDSPTTPTSDAFAAALRRKLDAFGVAPECRLTLGRRRTLRLHGKTIVGYEVILEHLTAEQSLNVQANTPPDPAQRFGRNHMGCGREKGDATHTSGIIRAFST
jgi:hypothetical protein